MKLLAFDTCFNKTYIVLKEDDNILSYEKIVSDDRNYHSAYLIPRLRDLLVEHNILIKDLSAIAVNIGPGSFTGIRAGITIARVLAQQFNIKLIGVPSLEILSRLNQNKNTLVALDARKNKVYFAGYTQGRETIAPCLIDKEELIPKIFTDDFPIVDRTLSVYLKENNINHLCYEDMDEDLGLYLADIATERYNKNEDYNWAKVKPLYIQKPSITMPKVVKNV